MSLLVACQSPKESREYLSLAGDWMLRLDSATTQEKVQLPGTTDTNKKGYPNTDRGETTHLSRPFRYQGKAWYTKEVTIPRDWTGKSIWLTLERTKPTRLWVDSVYVGACTDITVPQEYDLSPYLTAGRHQLMIEVDNGLSVPPQLLDNSHAYTESTQTNWNGIIGEMRLEARPLFHIHSIQVYPDAKQKCVQVKIQIKNPFEQAVKACVQVDLEAFNTDKKHSVAWKKEMMIQQDVLNFNIPMGEEALTWSEFSPALYRLTASIQGEQVYDRQSTTFGLRDFYVEGKQFSINGLTTFLRGKHDACVFPLTGHTPMDTAQWRRYFRIAKEYGINHCRFHSWCPPEACFAAADLEGVYLQPELPFWGKLEKKDTTLIRFLTKEGLRLQEAYGNHASFVMMAIGNELSGDQEVMVDMIDRFREEDSRHLFASGSNDYLGYNGPAPGDDYFTTCRVPGENIFPNHTRGSFSFADAEEGGYINHTYPNSEMSFDPAVQQSSLPVIGHETGQFQCYPNYEELKKYTGALKPWNLEIFQERLAQTGMASQADAFFKASGAWMVQLYKAEMEMAIRTPDMAGFQLLDLQDYPGQGTALVGVLDAFMDSKGLVAPADWRTSCDKVVLLALLPKFCYTEDEPIAGRFQIANYSDSALRGKWLRWSLEEATGNVVAHDSVEVNVAQGSLESVGALQIQRSATHVPGTYTLRLSLSGTDISNQYSLWIYPDNSTFKVPEGITVVHRWDKHVEQLLANGGKVLWFPEAQACEDVTVGGLFQTDYWNYRMFKSICEWVKKPISPGTLGLLMDPSHPIFKEFPTDSHTNWQWFSMVKQSRPLILDRLPLDYRPIVQVIDNVERNHKLGLIQEFQVGSGKLLICMSDLTKQQAYPEARQLYRSLLGYMASSDFKPTACLSIAQLTSLFTKTTGGKAIKVLGNISYE